MAPRASYAMRSWRCAAALALIAVPAARAAEPPPAIDAPSASVRQLAAWVTSTRDNRGLAFVIVDKSAARVFAVDPQGHVVGTASALLGLTRGDDSPVGIGDLPLSAITPAQRVTPAGRFVVQLGEDQSGTTVLWVDYDNAIALHAVVTSNPRERRLERLASASVQDKRISYGCINVPAAFFQSIVVPMFQRSGGIAYILPETRPVGAVFKGAEASASAR